MNFKDYASQDFNQIFFNLDEFAEIHNIDGMEIPIIIDADATEGRPRQPVDLYNAANGVFSGQIVIFVRFSDLGERPAIGQHLRLDEYLYLVSNCTESMGLLEITLEANRS